VNREVGNVLRNILLFVKECFDARLRLPRVPSADLRAAVPAVRLMEGDTSFTIASLGSISGFAAPVDFPLVGVFTDGLPSGSAPASYDYSGGVGQSTFAPLLNQVFFIGDGLTGTGSGSLQTFYVPATATQLWLGFADMHLSGGPPFAYGDNSGALTVSGTLSPAAESNPPSITSSGVVSASAFGEFTSVSPGSWIEIYGSNLAAATQSWTQANFTGINAPTSLGGTYVSIGGQAAFIDYISPGQVNALIPSIVATGSQPVTLKTAAGTSAPVTVTINAVQPGLLAPPSFNVNGVQYAVALFGDGSYVLPAAAISGITSQPAVPGDEIVLYGIVLWASDARHSRRSACRKSQQPRRLPDFYRRSAVQGGL
jgi:uncharacterized protein (TIGR03437 family)